MAVVFIYRGTAQNFNTASWSLHILQATPHTNLSMRGCAKPRHSPKPVPFRLERVRVRVASPSSSKAAYGRSAFSSRTVRQGSLHGSSPSMSYITTLSLRTESRWTSFPVILWPKPGELNTDLMQCYLAYSVRVVSRGVNIWGTDIAETHFMSCPSVKATAIFHDRVDWFGVHAVQNSYAQNQMLL
jgi:hypothetical protein